MTKITAVQGVISALFLQLVLR